jgi:hypothetical protein
MYAVLKSDGTVDLDSVENHIADVESRAGRVIRKILRKERINDADKEGFAHFLSVMYRRGPYTMDAFVPESLAPKIPDLHTEMVEQARQTFFDKPIYLERILSAVDKAIELASANLPSLTSQAILNSHNMGKVFSSFHWGFFVSKTARFVTSDTPVVFNRFTGIRDPQNSSILFPISSAMVLWLNQWMPIPYSYAEIPDNLVEDLNKRIIWNAFGEVYADHLSDSIEEYVNFNIGKGLPRKG